MQGVSRSRELSEESLNRGNMVYPSRRMFLSALAGFGASTILPSRASVPQTSTSSAGRRLIDVHHHILPPAYMAEARERVIAQGQGYLPAPVLQWTPMARPVWRR